MKSIHHFKEDDCYMINKHGEMENFTYNRNDRFDFSYRFPDLHYNKKITRFTFSGVYENEDTVFIKMSPLLSLDEEINFEDIKKKWYIFSNFTATSLKKQYIPRDIVRQKNNIDNYRVVLPEKIDTQSIIVTFEEGLVKTKPILDEISKRNIIFEYYTTGDSQAPKYYDEIEDVEHFSNGVLTNESVVSNILKSRKVSSYHGFIPQNKDDWEKAIKTIDELLDNKKGEEILLFKREDDLNISLDLEMTSPKIILTDFFKENIGEYVFQLYSNPKFCQGKDIVTLNRTTITYNMINDIREAFRTHEIEMKAFDSK